MIVLAMVAMCVLFFDVAAVEAARQFREDFPTFAITFWYFTNVGKLLWVMLIGVPLAVYLACNYWPVRGFSTIRERFGLYADANFVLFSVGFAGGGASLIKNLIGRARPRHMDALGPLHFDFARFDSGFASFPSGHSAVFGAMMVALALVMPKYKWVFLAIGALGGVSRVVLGAHYPSDVIGGLAWGAVVTLLIAHYLKRRGLLFAAGQTFWPQRHR
ncbi:phosphatase PAP2 family protein [Pseudahrensia aquimaris]|uniref:Phosphatase PAP2 family protein n=1 Tax=Pseudahrensia aquimaris TaxID=744461 RepID=A0ABW3FEA9_9HYPH